MDTVVTIKVFTQDSHHRTTAALIDSAVKRMEQIEALADNYQSGSELAMINRSAGQGGAALSVDMAALLERAWFIDSLSAGAFTAAIASLTELWGFGRHTEMSVPDPGDIQAALQHVGRRVFTLAPDRVYIHDPLGGFDLGGIAKGYAVDAAVEFLQRRGMADAQVDAGGDLRALSSSFTAGQRNVYVRHPLKSDGFYGRFPLDNGAVATSGDYERFFMAEGVRYHHILDPHTGYPARQCRSVTIVGATAALCDGLATAVFVLGPEKGMALIESTPAIEGLIIFEENGNLIHKISSGLEPVFEILHE